MIGFTGNEQWLGADGRAVQINGEQFKLHVVKINAIYPYERQVLDISARPIDTASKRYLEIRQQLGDDWSTDVTSDPELMAEVEAQLNL